MVRVLSRIAAWLAGTSLAVSLAWLGAGMVIRNTATPSPPVLSVAPAPPSGAAPSSAPGSTPPKPTPAATARPAPTPTPTATADGAVRDYALAGGHVTLLMSPTSAKLVAAVPDAGVSVQTWSGPSWLRVDFSSGPQVSSLIADWNGHAPLVTIAKLRCLAAADAIWFVSTRWRWSSPRSR